MSLNDADLEVVRLRRLAKANNQLARMYRKQADEACTRCALLMDVLDNVPLPSTMGTAQEHYRRFYEWFNGPVQVALGHSEMPDA